MASEFAENDGYGYLNMAASYFNMVAGDPYMKVSYLKRAARQPNRGDRLYSRGSCESYQLSAIVCDVEIVNNEWLLTFDV